MNAVISPITRNARSDHESTHQRSSPEENANVEACPIAQRLITGERIETNITELVLCAQANLAMARVAGAFDAAHVRSRTLTAAKRWAYRAGVAALCGTPHFRSASSDFADPARRLPGKVKPLNACNRCNQLSLVALLTRHPVFTHRLKAARRPRRHQLRNQPRVGSP